jgi:hypothetical protein
MSHRKAKVEKKTVTQELSCVSFIALNDFRADVLVGPYHVPVLFGVELGREAGRIDQVAEHDRQLPSFRVRRRRGSNARWDLRRGLFLHSRRGCRLRRRRGCGRDVCSGPSPHEYSAIFIRGELLCLDDLCLEGFEIFVIQTKAYLEGWVGNSPLSLQEGNDLIKKFVKGHDVLSAQPCSPFVNGLDQRRLQEGGA